MEEKKKTSCNVVIVIILMLMVLGLGGYITYDKILSNKDTNPTSNDTEKKEVDSKTNKSLYAFFELVTEEGIYKVMGLYDDLIGKEIVSYDSNEGQWIRYIYSNNNKIYYVLVNSLKNEQKKTYKAMYIDINDSTNTPVELFETEREFVFFDFNEKYLYTASGGDFYKYDLKTKEEKKLLQKAYECFIYDSKVYFDNNGTYHTMNFDESNITTINLTAYNTAKGNTKFVSGDQYSNLQSPYLIYNGKTIKNNHKSITFDGTTIYEAPDNEFINFGYSNNNDEITFLVAGSGQFDIAKYYKYNLKSKTLTETDQKNFKDGEVFYINR